PPPRMQGPPRLPDRPPPVRHRPRASPLHSRPRRANDAGPPRSDANLAPEATGDQAPEGVGHRRGWLSWGGRPGDRGAPKPHRRRDRRGRPTRLTNRRKELIEGGVPATEAAAAG